VPESESALRRTGWVCGLASAVSESTARAGVCAAVLLCAAAGPLAPLRAQNFDPLSGPEPGSLPGSIEILGPTNPLDAPSREYTGAPVMGWILYASILSGAVFDDNLYQTPTNQTKSWGIRLLPSIEAIRNNGIHKTKIYGFVDARFYGEDEQGDVYNSEAGIEHVWEAQRDLIFRFKGDASRTTDTSNGGIVATPTGFDTIEAPLTYNQFSGGASVYKSFDRIYFGLAGEVGRATFEDIEDSLGAVIPQGYRDQTAYLVKERLGAFISPVFYAFVESSQNWRQYADSSFNSDGQRIVGGVGSDRISLFRGEIYAGYQQQNYENPAFGTVSNFAFGGKVAWYPMRELTVRVSADRGINEATLYTPGNVTGSPIEDTGALLQADYRLTDIWSLSTRLGYDFIRYTQTTRKDNQWLAGLTASYFIWRDLALTFDYEYIDLNSNFAANDFSRNIYTFGGTYKF
jgi:Putative beta-barrel porin 2